MRKKIFITLLFTLLLLQPTYPQGDKDLYYRGLRAAQRGQIYFSFMYFDIILKEFPESKFFEGALFAVGEYYLLASDYSDAKKKFMQFIERYPKSKATIFAFVYLLKIAEVEGKENRVLDYKKNIVTFRQISLLFRDSQQINYESALSKNYKAIYFIDRVEIYIDEKSFTEIPF